MNTENKVQQMTDMLLEAKEAYYEEQPTMSDAHFDFMESQLRELAPNCEYFTRVGSPVLQGTKVKHVVPMGSLNKARSLEELEKWLANPNIFYNGEKHVVITEKLDGISVSLKYVYNKEKEHYEFAQAVTRGDGEVGESITQNVRFMQGFVHGFNGYDNGDMYVRGEILMRKDTWKKHFSESKSPRNLAAGIARRKTDRSECKYLSIVTYSIEAREKKELFTAIQWPKGEQIDILHSFGFLTPRTLRCVSPRCLFYIQEMADEREGSEYPIDGLVIDIDDMYHCNDLGLSGKNPRGAIAYKFEAEEEFSILTDITWQCGASGRITPVAHFEPVDIAGATISKASLHNLDKIKEISENAEGSQVACMGDTVKISRRGDVIPYVEAIMASGDDTQPPLVIPFVCNSCGSVLKRKGKYRICPNSECPAQLIGKIENWVKKIGVKHFGKKLIKELVISGRVKSLPEIYEISLQEFKRMAVNGRKYGKAGEKAYTNLHAVMNLPLDVFLGSLGIPLWGRSRFKSFIEYGFFSSDGLYSLDTILFICRNSPTAVFRAVGDAVGKELCNAFSSSDDPYPRTFNTLLGLGLTIQEPATTSSGDLDGKSFCFTGVRDKDLEAQIISRGGKIAKGVSKKLNMLIYKGTGSSKYKKASKLAGDGCSIVLMEHTENLKV